MNMKIYIIILALSFGVMILCAIIGGFLESSGTVTRETLGAQGITVIRAVYFVLFCVAAFALVPLALRFFIAMQIKIGNGELFLIQWLEGHEQTVVYCCWGLFILGLGLAFSLAKNDIVKLLK